MRHRNILSVKEYNEMQKTSYLEYKNKCIENNVFFESEQCMNNFYSPFYCLRQKYGFVLVIYHGFIWKRTKKELINYIS